MERGMSGINEHNEAIRKARFLDRAYYLKKKQDETSGTYEVEAGHYSTGSNPDYHSAQNVDMQRRQQVQQDQNKGYSAKVNKRSTNNDYLMQW